MTPAERPSPALTARLQRIAARVKSIRDCGGRPKCGPCNGQIVAILQDLDALLVTEGPTEHEQEEKEHDESLPR